MTDDKKDKIQLKKERVEDKPYAYVDSEHALKFHIPENYTRLFEGVTFEEMKGWLDKNRHSQISKLDSKKHSFSFITDKLKNKDFLDEMLKTRNSFAEMMDHDELYKKIVKEKPEVKALIDAFSDALEYSLSSGTIRNPQLAESNRIKADDFAKTMGKHLKAVRKEGITSTRKIANRFNELEIKSFRVSKWSHNQVSVLIRRRKELGLEDDA